METFIHRLPEIVIQLIAFAFALSVHESAHGWMADKLGDPTARWLGRITLNPIKHIDPIGSIAFPILLAIIGAPIFGWAKPVPFVTRNLRKPRRDSALVGLAGPLSNIILALATILVLLVFKGVLPDFRIIVGSVIEHGALGTSGIAAPLLYLLFILALINLFLAVFNLIPIPPLDGSHIMTSILPPRLAWRYIELRQFGMFLLAALVFTGFLGIIFNPVYNALIWILLS